MEKVLENRTLTALAICGAFMLPAWFTHIKPQLPLGVGSNAMVEQVSTILMNRLPKNYHPQVDEIALHIVEVSKEFAFDPLFILAVIEIESSFRPKVKSTAGAVGLMQIQAATARYVAEKYGITNYKEAKDLLDPLVNIRIGVSYLSYLRAKYADMESALMAYNYGPSAVRRFSLSAPQRSKYVLDVGSSVRGFRDLMRL